jgi:hypothetical protein
MANDATLLVTIGLISHGYRLVIESLKSTRNVIGERAGFHYQTMVIYRHTPKYSHTHECIAQTP